MKIRFLRIAGSLLLSITFLALAACGSGESSRGGTDGGGNPVPQAYSVGGTVTGLSVPGLRIHNGSTDLDIAAAGPFTFPATLASGTAYNVTIVLQPATQVCTVSQGSGAVGTNNVTSVAITCATTTPPGGDGGMPTYSIGGTLAGLAGTGLEIQNGDTDDLPVAANGGFTFTTTLASGSPYKVTVITQPSSPAQVCTVSNGSGTVATSNVTNVAITCTTTPPLTLTSSTPATSATDVLRGTGPVLSFSTSLDPATLTTSAVALKSAAGNVAITVSTSGNKLSVVSADPLLPLTAYTLTVGSGAVRGTAGEQLANPITVTFTTRDQSWQTAKLINSPGMVDARNPQVAMDAHGNALVVSEQGQTLGAQHRIQSIRQRTSGNFGNGAAIDSGAGNNSWDAQIAMDASGNALAVWTFNDGFRVDIWSNRYIPGGGWGTAASIEAGTPAGDASSAHLAVNAHGYAVAVWLRGVTGPRQVWVNRYDPSSGWATAAAIPGAQAVLGSEPHVAVDANNNAFVVWQQTNGSHVDIMSRLYVFGTGWDAVRPVDTSNTGTASVPQVAFDSDGNALATWVQRDGSSFRIRSNRYSPGNGWGIAEMIEAQNIGTAVGPQIAMDASGNAIAVWEQNTGTGNFAIWSNRYTVGSGWGAAAPIETDPYDASSPQIAMDASGNAIAVWSEEESSLSFRTWSSRYTSAGGWSPSARIQTDSISSLNPRLAVNPSGDAVVVWEQVISLDVHEVWSNQFE